MKLSFLAKRTRPDILLAVSFLAMRMKSPNHYDASKLQRTRENTGTSRVLTGTPPPGTNSSVGGSNSGAVGDKRKYPPHQSLVPPTLNVETIGISITNNVVVSSNIIMTLIFFNEL